MAKVDRTPQEMPNDCLIRGFFSVCVLQVYCLSFLNTRLCFLLLWMAVT